MNRDYAETYEEHKSGKYEYVKGFGRLGCYQGLDYFETLLRNGKYYSEKLEDSFIFIESYINSIEQQVKKQKEVIDKAIEFIDYSSKEIDIEDTYNEIVQTYSLTYDDVDELLDILNEVSEWVYMKQV